MDDMKLVMTEAGFLSEFLQQHGQRPDRPFCFILGAGVSRPSGIPTGGELATIWLREIFEAEHFDQLTIEQWATAERLGIPEFEYDAPARFYSHLYQRRYGDHEQAGYAFLESQMEGKEPSYGYSVLAYLLSETHHRVVVTTNFDNLVADALSIHSSRFPLVVGHDALAQYAAVELRRPLVAKIHGALGFAPKNQPNDIASLPEGWRIALRRILERYTPIVIGYEGNDGSLMGFLKSLPEYIPDRILWCVRAPDARPEACLDRVPAEVRAFVRTRRGRFTPIRGFDELMAKLLSKLRERSAVPDLYERMKERARLRERNYDEQQRKLFEASVPSVRTEGARDSLPPSLSTDMALSEAVSEIAESRKDKPWWVWSREASSAPSADKAEEVYKRALAALPESADLLWAYALFLEQDRQDHDGAERIYSKSLSLDPLNTTALTFYADFLVKFRNEPDKAEEHFQRSIAIDSNGEYALAKYALFLERTRKNVELAEAYYQRAVNAAPQYGFALVSYARFLEFNRQDMDKAEEMYIRATEAEPNDAYNLGQYARFLRSVRGNTVKAAELEKRVESIDKNKGA